MMSPRTRCRAGFSFENLMWIFTRVSGAALIMTGLIGVTGAFMMGARTQVDVGALARWTYFPNPNHVANTQIPDVSIGWGTAYWQVLEIMVLIFAATHGVNGLRVVVEDYLGQSALRVFLRGFLLIFWQFMIIMAIFVILAS
jgi:succinate dehydrogenase hydrophobic anchor subunit